MQMHEPRSRAARCEARELETLVARTFVRRPLHIIKLPSIEAVNALSEQLNASAAARKS